MAKVTLSREDYYGIIREAKAECAAEYAEWYVVNKPRNAKEGREALLEAGRVEFETVFKENFTNPIRRILARRMGEEKASAYLNRHVGWLAVTEGGRFRVSRADRLDFPIPPDVPGGPNDTMQRIVVSIGGGSHGLFPMLHIDDILLRDKHLNRIKLAKMIDVSKIEILGKAKTKLTPVEPDPKAEKAKGKKVRKPKRDDITPPSGKPKDEPNPA